VVNIYKHAFTYLHHPGIEPRTFRSQVKHSNHYSTGRLENWRQVHYASARRLSQTHRRTPKRRRPIAMPFPINAGWSIKCRLKRKSSIVGYCKREAVVIWTEKSNWLSHQPMLFNDISPAVRHFINKTQWSATRPLNLPPLSIQSILQEMLRRKLHLQHCVPGNVPHLITSNFVRSQTIFTIFYQRKE